MEATEEEEANHMQLRTRAWSQTARVQFLAPPLTTNVTWTSYLISQCLGFLICTMRQIKLPAKSLYEDE